MERGNRSTVPACQSIRQAVAVRPCAAPVSVSTVATVANIERAAPDSSATYPPPSNAATLRNRPRRFVASLSGKPRPCAPDSGKRPATYPPPSNAATVRRLSAVRPFRRTSRQPIRQAVTVRRGATVRPCRRIRPPVYPPATSNAPRRIRRHRAPLARLNRAENALASRPPFRPCPRPSETRRALCKPSATVCNAISGKRPAIRRTSRPISAATVCRIRRQSIRQGFRQAVANAPQPFRPVCNQRQPWRPFDRCPFALQSRQPFDPRPLKSRRKRPCKPSAAPPMSAPV